MDIIAPTSLGVSSGLSLGGVERVSVDAPPLKITDNTTSAHATATPISSAPVRVGRALLSPDAILALSPSSQVRASTSTPNSGEKTAPFSQQSGESSGQDTDAGGLTKEEQAIVRALQKRDAEVRRHEQAHAAVGGAYASAPTYTTQRGPDGKLYAIGGEVMIDTSPIPDNPEATIAKMEIVVRAALAPANPPVKTLALLPKPTKPLPRRLTPSPDAMRALIPCRTTPRRTTIPPTQNRPSENTNTQTTDSIGGQPISANQKSGVIPIASVGKIIDQFS